MTTNKANIIFMGTPEFAVSSLKILIDNNYNIKAVVTAADKPAGRGKKIQFSDVKKFALENNLKILQPDKLKSEYFLNELKNLNADLFIVVAFRMLPRQVWELPKLGTFNLHASLLPDYRGAAPINHAIINGDTKTGVTTFFINEEIDKGNILFRESIEIEPKDNAGSLHDKLMHIGAELVLKTVQAIENNNVQLHKQEEFINDTLHPAPKIFKDSCRIDWEKPAKGINDLIRGLSPYPAAWTELNNPEKTQVKLYETSFIIDEHHYKNGTIITDNKTYLKVAVKDGFIDVLELQIQGKKRLKIKELLNGYKFTENDFFV
ncbi:MAG: methionyl-tRNA formyltransferase [Bacteroidales bacterium]|nr:methionyl-tRNA formyltransferase [Bacteroidales bacterium]